MTPEEKLRLTMKADIFKALGQPTRLRIVEILYENEMPVGRIAARLGPDAPTVSKHLALLRKQGLVVDRKQGSQIFYSGTIPQLIRFIRCVGRVVRKRTNAPMNSTLKCSEKY